MTTPISHISSRTIGTVESVAPENITVLLDTDSPKSTAFSEGIPVSFPKINNYVLLPSETGAIVGVIVWIGIERSGYPKRTGHDDFELIDLPFPLRKMNVCPMGTLSGTKSKQWKLERGVQSYPSVGDLVILPTADQLAAIVTGTAEDGRMTVGTCPTAHQASISVNPDTLFGRHLAVLGNTGSGKSCTVAGIIQSAITSAQQEIESTKPSVTHPNARFIVLDPNGEYSRCFNGSRVFKVQSDLVEGVLPFKLPAWMWNSSEWASIAQAATKTQRPLLQKALRELRTGTSDWAGLDVKAKVWIRVRTLLSSISRYRFTGVTGYPDLGNCGGALEIALPDFEAYLRDQTFPEPYKGELAFLVSVLKVESIEKNNAGYYPSIRNVFLNSVCEQCEKIINLYPISYQSGCINEDNPTYFNLTQLADHLELIAANEPNNAGQYISTLLLRIKAILGDSRMSGVIAPEEDIALETWLNMVIGDGGGANVQVTVLDLSLVPHEILHLVIAVTSRLILEAHQRYRNSNSQKDNLPTVLVLEEAHTFISKNSNRSDDIPTPSEMCRATFERIAREGRKFGIGLLLSSQRPSELSETVLSQCNSFMLHRITNDRDQELIARLVPDTSRGLLRELPCLPTSHYILLGAASKLPILIQAHKLENGQRPDSDDPEFWDVWTGKKERSIDWEQIVNEWGQATDECEIVDKEEE
ncbi:MAG: ATP-binding protein [Halodesulfovibrio sp.]|uniref:ATP-binding protein n=1 Tax=Halodesulfovibrio sp. TaxID=1912772 RepID=UPI00359DF86B